MFSSAKSTFRYKLAIALLLKVSGINQGQLFLLTTSTNHPSPRRIILYFDTLCFIVNIHYFLVASVKIARL